MVQKDVQVQRNKTNLHLQNNQWENVSTQDNNQ